MPTTSDLIAFCRKRGACEEEVSRLVFCEQHHLRLEDVWTLCNDGRAIRWLAAELGIAIANPPAIELWRTATREAWIRVGLSHGPKAAYFRGRIYARLLRERLRYEDFEAALEEETRSWA